MPQKLGIGIGVCNGGRFVDDQALPSYAFSPQAMTGATLWLPTHSTRSMWVEYDQQSSTIQATRPSAGSLIGFIDEPIGAFMIATTSAGTRPTLNSDSGSRNAYLTFGSGQQLVVDNSTAAFRNFHCGLIGYICLWVRFPGGASDGSNLNTILDGINNSGSSVGLNLRRDTDNKCTFQIGNGAGSILSISTDTLLNDAAWHSIVIKVASGASASSVTIDGGTPKTGTCGAALTAGTDATFNLQIGRRVDTTKPGQCDISNLVIGSTALSAGDLTNWLAHNPTISSGTLERFTAAGNSLTPNQVSGLHTWFDCSDLTMLWTTTARSVQVSADANVGYIDNKKTAPSGCSYKRDASQSTAGKRPTWKANQSNSQGAIRFAGTATDIQSSDVASDYTGEQDLSFTPWYKGAKTWLAVYRNNDTLLGSHVLRHGYAIYMVQCGSAYSTPEDTDQATQHWGGNIQGNTGTAIDASHQAVNGGEGMTVVAVWQEGINAKIFQDNYGGETTSDSGQWAPSHMGRPGITGWDMSGEVFEVCCFNMHLSDATIRKLTNYFATKYAIANVPTTLTP